jgi:hypothetical protein
MGKKIRILDLDNCIADDGWRIQYIDWTQPDPDKRYELYHLLSNKDEARNTHLADAYRYDIVFFTARPERYRSKTLKWLERHGIRHKAILMRGADDSRPSAVLKSWQLSELLTSCDINDIQDAFDDREDVVEMYRALGIYSEVIRIHDLCAYTSPVLAKPIVVNEGELDSRTEPKVAADILIEMGNTFRERNKVYGDNYKRVGAAMEAMFPNGVFLKTTDDFNRWHLFELIIVKLTRFANSGLTHTDSIHDAAVYAAMVESLTNENSAKINEETA